MKNSLPVTGKGGTISITAYILNHEGGECKRRKVELSREAFQQRTKICSLGTQMHNIG